jgi:hypothetical protein
MTIAPGTSVNMRFLLITGLWRNAEESACHHCGKRLMMTLRPDP